MDGGFGYEFVPASSADVDELRAQVRYTLLSERPLDELRAFMN
jgi:hypothetical protein